MNLIELKKGENVQNTSLDYNVKLNFIKIML